MAAQPATPVIATGTTVRVVNPWSQHHGELFKVRAATDGAVLVIRGADSRNFCGEPRDVLSFYLFEVEPVL